MSPAAPIRKTALLMGIALGLLIFAAGVTLATAFLPEWRVEGPALDKDAFRERYRELAAKAGLSLEPGEPRVFFNTGGQQAYETFRPQGDAGSAWLLAERTAVRVEVVHEIQGSRDAPGGNLIVNFSLDGKPQLISLWQRNPFELQPPEVATRLSARVAPLVLQPGESLGPQRQELFANSSLLLYPLRDSSRPEHLVVMSAGAYTALRVPGPLSDRAVAVFEARMARVFGTVFWRLLAFAAVLGLFVVLALRSRLSVVNGSLLALITLATLNPAPTATLGVWLWSVPVAVALGAWVFLLWSAAESLLRSNGAEFTTSLDALRRGRLGPRGGRALLLGLGFGAAVAGLRLALFCLAEVLPGVWPLAPALDLPLSSALGSPVKDGVYLAGGVALALALAIRLLPLRWAPLAAALAAGILLSPVLIHPFPAKLVAGTLLAGPLVYVARQHGLMALLTTTVVSSLLPAAAFSGLHPGWMAGGFAGTVLPLAAFLALGWLGLSRSAAAEVQRLSPPGFVRRLEEERRLKHEMGLLARMQLGLLPRTLPRLRGWDLAARSVLANEAGGDLYDVLWDEDGHLWLAAGDVAGHGYSCAIAQAMTKSALASLIGRGRAPAEILQRVDRVLRAAGLGRNFTTLSLLRLDIETGEALLSNAGAPYPLLAADGKVEELELPGLPLGQGPARRYEDRPLRLSPGSVLAFCSDGLFEAVDGDGSFYGFDRARAVLRVAAGRSASQVLEALMADWSHFLRAARPLDDTTVVVLKREVL